MRIPCLGTLALLGFAIPACDKSHKPDVPRSAEAEAPVPAPHDPVKAAKPVVESHKPEIPLMAEADRLMRASQDLIEAAKSVPDKVREANELVHFLHASLRELHAYVAENDYEKARAAAAAIDRLMKSRTFSWYLQILAKEEADGVPAALTLIEELRKSENISDIEKGGLSYFETFLHNKGDLKSLDVIFLVSAAILEAKFGKGAGVPLLALQYPLRPKDGSSVILEKLLKGEFGGEGDEVGPSARPDAQETK